MRFQNVGIAPKAVISVVKHHAAAVVCASGRLLRLQGAEHFRVAISQLQEVSHSRLLVPVVELIFDDHSCGDAVDLYAL